MQFITVQPLLRSAMVSKSALAMRLKIKLMPLLVGWEMLVLSVLVKNLITLELILLQLLAYRNTVMKDLLLHIDSSVNEAWSSWWLVETRAIKAP